MKRSDIEAALTEMAQWGRQGSTGEDLRPKRIAVIEHLVGKGLVLDPEEPEVLWGRGDWRFTEEKVWEQRRGPEWAEGVILHEDAPVYDELARRILAEREERKQEREWSALIEDRDTMMQQRNERANRAANLESQLSAQKQIEESLRAEIRERNRRIEEGDATATALREEVRALHNSIEPTRKRLGRLERNIERAKAALVGCEIASGGRE